MPILYKPSIKLVSIGFWPRKLEARSLKLEAGSWKQGIIQYQESIKYVSIGSWLLALGGSSSYTANKRRSTPV